MYEEDLLSLALTVLKSYDVSPAEILVVQSGTIKTVWKIKTDKGAFCLKRLKQDMEKALFSVNAQIYIKNNGGKVADVVRDRKGNPIVVYNGQLFVLYRWIDGANISFNSRDGLCKAVKGLAKFHIASKGYIPPDIGARPSSKLGKWPSQYFSMRSRMAEWREMALKKPSQGSYEAYLQYSGPIIEMADRASELLEKSSYNELAAEGSASVVLCHQDYGKGNVLLLGEDVYVLDLDGVTFDLPARDLRKIIGKTAENHNLWNSETVTDIINWYTEENPFGKNELEVLYIDLLFPHWYFGLLKNMFQAGKQVKKQEIERIGKLENAKRLVIEELLGKTVAGKANLPRKE